MADTRYLTVEKCKVGPISERYQNGEFRAVESDPDGGPRRMAVLGLDGSHSGDYKVGYASDPVIVVTSTAESDHESLRDWLKDAGLWIESFRPIEVPHTDGWKSAFASTPEAKNRVGMFRARAEALAENEHDVMGEGDSFAAYLPD